MKKIILLCPVYFSILLCQAQTVATFENLTLSPDTFWTGSGAGGFSSGEAFFVNSFDTSAGQSLLNGFTYSNMFGDTALLTDSPVTNSLKYSAVTGIGFGGSPNYAIGRDTGNTKVYLTGNGKGGVVSGFYATNTTYAFLSMKHGDSNEPAFSYSNGDTFVLHITGWHDGAPNGDTVSFYLADFRDSTFTPADTFIVAPDTTYIYNINDSIIGMTVTPADTVIDTAFLTISPGILTSWKWVDLSGLGNVDSLIFSLASSQNGLNGINTPVYFAMDNFTTSDMLDDFITINYLQDTVIGIWPFFRDSAALAAPYVVSVVAGPNVAGATASILNDSIWYIPSDGIVTVDTVTYAVCGANSQCITARIIINITGLTGIGEISQSLSRADVYPNPFQNSFKINYTGDLRELRLYDLQGSLLKTVTSAPDGGEIEINASQYAEGIYVLRIVTSNGVATAKIVKQ